MKTTRNLLASAVAASALSMAMVPAANAEVEVAASAAISSSYHWRGFDLGSGTPAISGDIFASVSGFYAGMWASSGDTTAGTEYDLIVGYGGEVGDFSYDINYTTYVYPTGDFEETEGVGDFAEIIVGLGYGPVSVFYHQNISGASDAEAAAETRYAFLDGEYSYFGISAEFGAFSATLAKHDEGKTASFDTSGNFVAIVDISEANPGVTGDATHLDLTYAYNDNLAFTLSTILDSDLGDGEPEPKFVVSYSIPIE